MALGGGLSATRLERLTRYLQGAVERGEIAGVAALVARHEQVHVDAVGVLDLMTGAPVRRDSLFRIASMTKPIAAVAAMILVEEGRLRLDEPVDRLLPELADRKVLRRLDGPVDDTEPARRPLTLRDLLTMRAGYGAIMAPPGTYPIQAAVEAAGIGPGATPPALDPDALIQRFATLPLLNQPGERWLYHSAYEVLAVLVARAAGMGFERFLAERIFEPLGMRDTGFSVPAAKLDRLATAYMVDPGTGALMPADEVSGGDARRHEVFASGGSGLVSTVDDYLAFGRMMMNYGRYGSARILARPTVEAMTTDQLTGEQKLASGFFPGFWDNHGWGFGVSMILKRDDISAVPGRYGWDGGFGTRWSSDPAEDMVAILLIQRMMRGAGGDDIQGDFLTLAYQAIDD